MNPLAVMQIASAFAKAGADVAGFIGQNKASKVNARNANTDYYNTLGALNIRGAQETEATQQTIMQSDRAARGADAMARVSAGESGVAGASVDALLSDISRQGLDAKLGAEQNLGNTLAQIKLEKAGALAQRNSRISAVPKASPFLLGMQILGASADEGSDYLKSLPRGGK